MECSDYSFVTTVPVQNKCFSYRILVGIFDSFLISKLYRRAIDGLEGNVAAVFCVVLEKVWVFLTVTGWNQRRVLCLHLHIGHLSWHIQCSGRLTTEEQLRLDVFLFECSDLKKNYWKRKSREVALALLWSIKLFSKLFFYDFDDRKPHKFTNDKNCDKNIRKYRRNDRGLGLKRDKLPGCMWFPWRE